MNTPIKTGLMLAVILILILPGCKKNATVSAAKVKAKKTSGYGGFYPNDTLNYTYNSDGRLVVQQGKYDVITYSYDNNEVTAIQNANTTTIYHLNTQGYAVSDDKGNTYAYEASGLPVLQLNQFSDTVFANKISNGDVMSYTTRTQGPIATDSFTYYPSVEMRDFGSSFLGRGNTHSLHTETLTSAPGASFSFKIILSHTYEYDGLDRIQKETITSMTNNTVWAVVKYDYY